MYCGTNLSIITLPTMNLYTIQVQHTLHKFSKYTRQSTNTGRVQDTQVSEIASLEDQREHQATRPEQAGSLMQAQSAWQQGGAKSCSPEKHSHPFMHNLVVHCLHLSGKRCPQIHKGYIVLWRSSTKTSKRSRHNTVIKIATSRARHLWSKLSLSRPLAPHLFDITPPL